MLLVPTPHWTSTFLLLNELVLRGCPIPWYFDCPNALVTTIPAYVIYHPGVVT